MELRYKQRWEPEVRKFFRDIVSVFQIDEVHYATFYGTCENLNTFHIANNALTNEGLTFKSTTGQIRKHPAFQIKKDSWGSFLMGLKALGLHETKKIGRPGG